MTGDWRLTRQLSLLQDSMSSREGLIPSQVDRGMTEKLRMADFCRRLSSKLCALLLVAMLVDSRLVRLPSYRSSFKKTRHPRARICMMTARCVL